MSKYNKVMIDEAEEESGLAEYHAALYNAFHTAKAGLATPEDWDFLESALGCNATGLTIKPLVEVNEPAPF